MTERRGTVRRPAAENAEPRPRRPRFRARAPVRSTKPMTGREGGFSLLEILTAFVIVSLVVTALFRLFSGALANVGAAEDWSRAMTVAESRLEETAHAASVREGTATGTEDDGRIAWTTTVALYTPPEVSPELERASESLVARLYRISVDVRFPGADGRERTIALATVRIAPRVTR